MNVAFLNAWGLFFRGGPMMWPILILSILAVTIAIEKILTLNKVSRTIQSLKKNVFDAIRDNRLKDALALCEASDAATAQVFKAGILKYGQSRDSVTSAMNQAAAVVINDLKQRMGILSLITNAAPMLGLLGTITGMCVVFHAVQMRSNALNPLNLGDMSSGVWQALLTTAAGLVVGIVSLSVHSFCAQRINDIIVDMEQDIAQTIDLVHAVSDSHNAFPIEP